MTRRAAAVTGGADRPRRVGCQAPGGAQRCTGTACKLRRAGLAAAAPDLLSRATAPRLRRHGLCAAARVPGPGARLARALQAEQGGVGGLVGEQVLAGGLAQHLRALRDVQDVVHHLCARGRWLKPMLGFQYRV